MSSLVDRWVPGGHLDPSLDDEPTSPVFLVGSDDDDLTSSAPSTDPIQALTDIIGAAGLHTQHAPSLDQACRHAAVEGAAAIVLLVGNDLSREPQWSRIRRPSGIPLILVRATPYPLEGVDPAWPLALRLEAEAFVTLPDGSTQLLEHLRSPVGADQASGALRIGVVGACGGAGATSFALLLSAALARIGPRVALVDAGSHRGGLDLFVAAGTEGGLCWDDIGDDPGTIPAGPFFESLPRLGDVAVLAHRARSFETRASRVPGLVLRAPAGPFEGLSSDPPVAEREKCTGSVLSLLASQTDVLIVDVPRCAAPRIGPSLDRVFLIVPASLRGAEAAGDVVADGPLAMLPTSLVTRIGSGPCLDPETISEGLGIPLAGVFKDERPVEHAMDSALVSLAGGRHGLARLARTLAGSILETHGASAHGHPLLTKRPGE